MKGLFSFVLGIKEYVILILSNFNVLRYNLWNKMYNNVVVLGN